METLKDIPTISQHFLFFYTQGSSGNTYDNQVVSSSVPYSSIFSSLTGIDSVSGEMVAGNFKITLTLGTGPMMNYPTFNVVVDNYTIGMRGEVECKYTEPIVFDFPCTVTTKGAAATSTKPAIAAHTQAFLIRVIIANHQMPLSYYGARSSMGVKGDRGSVGVSTTAGRRASKTYETYTKIVEGVSTPGQTVINENEFAGYPGTKVMSGYAYFWRPGIYTSLSDIQLGTMGYRIQIPYSTFVLEEYGLPGTVILVDPGVARKETGTPALPYNNLWVYSASIPEISGAYNSMGDPYTLIVTVDSTRIAYRFAKVTTVWGFYTLQLTSTMYYPPAGVDGWTCLDTNNSAPAAQTGVPHWGWSYGGMIVVGAADRIVSPKVASAKSPAPSYSLGGYYNGHYYYEANQPLPTEVFEGYAQPNHQGVNQSFWRYVVCKDDEAGYVLSDTLTPGGNSCPVEVGEFPCALPVAPPALEKYGDEAIRDSILKANNMALNINRKPSAFNQYAILGKADNALLDINLNKLDQDALIAGGIWGYYPLARQLQVPTATAGDPSYPAGMTLHHTQTSNATCSVHIIEDTHSCDLDREQDLSCRSQELTANFMPTNDFNSGLFGPPCYNLRIAISLSGLGTYSLSDNGTVASGSLVTMSDYTPSASGMTENYSFSCSKSWSGDANCVSRNGDLVDSLHNVDTAPIPFQISSTRDASMTQVFEYFEPNSNGDLVLKTRTMPYSAELSYQKNGAALWEDQSNPLYGYGGPNRVGGAASIQLVSGYAEKSPQAADKTSDTAELYCDDLHRVYTTANAYMLHNGKVSGTGTATFKQLSMPGPGVEPVYVTVTRDVGNSYGHMGSTALTSDEACLIPKDFSSFPISPKSAKQANDLFVRMCAKLYFAHESTWTNGGQKLSYCRIRVTRVIDMKSSIMASEETDGMTGSAITTIEFIERRNKQDQTVLFEKFYDDSGDKFEELVTEYQNYYPEDWGTVVFPDPPVKNWVDPNQSYTPAARNLTFVQKHTAVVNYVRRNRTEITLSSQ